MGLKPNDQQYLDALKNLGIAEKLDPNRIEEDGIIIGCGDCDRVHEFLRWHKKLVRANGKEPRFHLILVNGGPLNFAWRWPWWHAWRLLQWIIFLINLMFLMGQIRGAILLKGLKRIIVVPHWPCGQGGLWGLDLKQAVEIVMRVVALLKRKFPDCEIVVRLHADKQVEWNTYHLCPRLYNQGKAVELLAPVELSA